MSRNRLSWLLWGIATVAAAAIAFAWFAPSNDYLYVPNRATPVGDKVKVVTVDVVANEGLAQAYKIAVVPSLLVFKNGVELNRLVGLKDLHYLREALDV